MKSLKRILFIFSFAVFIFSCEKEDRFEDSNTKYELVSSFEDFGQQNKATPPCDCGIPDFDSYYICQHPGGGLGHIINIYGGVDPSTIEKIHVQLQTCGTFRPNGSLGGLSSGFIYPSTVQLPLLFSGCVAPYDCVSGTSYNVRLIYYYNNGCVKDTIQKNIPYDYIP